MALCPGYDFFFCTRNTRWFPDVEVEPEAALLWCWGKCDEACFLAYLERYRGGLVIVIAARDVWCSPSIDDMREALQRDCGWELRREWPCQTLGRPSDCAVFTNTDRLPSK